MDPARALVARYLGAYPEPLQAQIHGLLSGDGADLAALLLRKYPDGHAVRSDTALYDYVGALKARHLRSAPPLHKVAFDNSMHAVRNALGLQISTSRVQGRKLSARREIRIASLFRHGPEEFLRMITVHELAHLRERHHDKSFYQLCQHMEPSYHQLEFDLRVYLTYCEFAGNRLWMPNAIDSIASSV